MCGPKAQPFTQPFPERGFAVKGRFWDFLWCVTCYAHSIDQEVAKDFFRPVFVFPRSMMCNGVVAVFFGEVVEPFFSHAAAPHIHPFVNPSAEIRRPSKANGPDTEYSGSTVSQTQAASIRATPAESAGPQGWAGWLCAARASSSKEEGPMHPYLPPFTSPRAIIPRLAKRSRALLASNPTRDSQVKGASRTRGRRGHQTTTAFLFFSP
jgi:hypothetical protein